MKPYVICAILVMAGVTYLVRVIPIFFVKGTIKSPFFRAFLHYIPFAVLAAMIFPAILYSTPSVPSAVAGLVVAVALALCNRGLVTVAASSVVTVFVVEQLLRLF